MGTTGNIQPWDGPAVVHVDLDAFFASVEQLDHPEWRGLPVIVGGDPDRRGVVSTCSYEARPFGIHSAMSSARAVMLCPHAIWAPPRFARYHEMSSLVMEILADESPHMRQVSIDEAFLDISPGRFTVEHPVSIVERIRSRVAELGITCSAGVANTMTVAKIASDLDKPNGLTVVYPGEEASFLAPLPVGRMPGIGPKTSARLVSLGVRTLGDLAALDDSTTLAVLGTSGPESVRRAAGVDSRSVVAHANAKSISNEHTFSADVRTPEEVRDALREIAAKVGSRARAKGDTGTTVTVKMRFSDFSTRTVRRTLPEPTDDERVFGPIAFDLLRHAWTPGVGLRLLGVGLSGFGQKAVQMELPIAGARRTDEAIGSEDARGLSAEVDRIREKFGSDSVRFGRELERKPKG